MTDMFLLSADQMSKIEPFSPKSYGVARVDDCRVISGIIYVLKHGLVTVWFRLLVSHYATLASKAKGLMPPRYE
jgi:hypothetical protein